MSGHHFLVDVAMVKAIPGSAHSNTMLLQYSITQLRKKCRGDSLQGQPLGRMCEGTCFVWHAS